MNILNRPAIKFEAKNFIGSDKRFLYMFWAGILPLVISFAKDYVNYYIMIKSNYYEDLLMVNPIMYNLAWLFPLTNLLIIPISISIYGYYLSCLRKQDFSSAYVYQTASKNYIKFLFTGIVQKVLTYLWGLLFVIPGVIKSLAYSMTPYIICDNPALSSMDAIEISTRITRGYKTEIMLMYLSFIPWIILSGITFGIANIYVMPYMKTTEAMFYENLKKNAIENDTASASEFMCN